MRHLFSFSRLSRALFRARWRADSRVIRALSRVWPCIVRACRVCPRVVLHDVVLFRARKFASLRISRVIKLLI
jgi:hypothetical protein